MLRTFTVGPDERRRYVRFYFLSMLRRRWALLTLFVVAGGPAVTTMAYDEPAATPFLAAIPVSLALVAAVAAGHWAGARARAQGLERSKVFAMGYSGPAHLVLQDETGTVWFPRGSVVGWGRDGPLTVLRTDSSRVVAPSELFDDDDLAFLTGRDGATAKKAVEPLPPWLPNSLVLTRDMQRAIVAVRSRQALTSSIVLFWLTLAACLAALGVVLAVAGVNPTLLVVMTLWMLVCAWQPVAAMRKRLRRLLPVGRIVRGAVDAEGFTVRQTEVTVRTPWSRYAAHRLSPRLVILRRRRAWRTRTAVLPTDLFRFDDLRTVIEKVPRTF